MGFLEIPPRVFFWFGGNMFHLLYELKWFYKAHKKSYHIALTALVFIDVFI